ncbi:ABC transporter ATP-binding protein [Puia sp.]|jgi:iron complex transport system ATP-binding protein|uniref:ABC transporter ATP-binding protein n=1 Tax=Puia sp. TaxID=2045100 RepID=UPI002F429C56
MNTAPLLITRSLQTGYHSGGKKTLVSTQLPELTVKAGRLICLLGPNGSGKSTLLKTLAGLQPALSGGVEIAGRSGLSSAGLARQISLVLTDRVGGSNLNVWSLVALGRYPWSGWLGILTETDKAIIRQAIDAADIAALVDRKVHTLSDGESQKVMLARALAQDTPILMLDEPTAHLDLPSRIRLMRLLHQLTREMNKGIILSTHELDLALQVADEVWLLQSAAPMHKGTPEDLVLDGIFEAAFEKEDVSFDRSTGVFRIHRDGDRSIQLASSGMVAFWTRRALQREGFTVQEAGMATDMSGDRSNAMTGTASAPDVPAAAASARITILEQQGRPVWILQTAAGSRQSDSVAGLLEALKDFHFP